MKLKARLSTLKRHAIRFLELMASGTMPQDRERDPEWWRHGGGWAG